MEFKDQLHCSMCMHKYAEQGKLSTKIRYCPKCHKFTDTMIIRINVETDTKPRKKQVDDKEPKFARVS